MGQYDMIKLLNNAMLLNDRAYGFETLSILGFLTSKCSHKEQDCPKGMGEGLYVIVPIQSSV